MLETILQASEMDLGLSELQKFCRKNHRKIDALKSLYLETDESQNTVAKKLTYIEFLVLYILTKLH